MNPTIYDTKAAEQILAARTTQAQREALIHWGTFVPFSPSPMRADQSDVDHIESTYLVLRQYAYQWLTHYLLTTLEARVEALENPNGGKMRDPFEDYR